MASSVLDFLSGGTPPPAPTGSDVATGGPLWLQDYMANTLGASQALASQPYTPYPGPTVAAPSSQTQQAWNLAGQNVGSWQPNFQQAGALTQNMATPLTPASINNFINPYQNYVTGALNRNLQQNLLPSIQDEFVSAGQSRSPQEAEMTQRALQGTQTAIGESLAGGYQGAVNSAQAQQQLQGQAGAQLGALGQTQAQLGALDVGQLAASGSAQDAVAQANLNAAQQQFQNQQQWPYQQLGFLSNIVRGLPTSQAGSNTQTVGTTYNYAPTASPLASFVGGVMGGQKLGMRRGGRVRHPAFHGALARLRRAA